jgi:predicted Fe-Mo cluster-binding NifX family protein
MGTRGLDEKVGKHIRLVPNFTVFDTETSVVKVLKNPGSIPDRTDDLADMMTKEGIDIIIVVDIDPNLAGSFERAGIVVYRGASGCVSDSIEMYDRYLLEPVTDELMCRQYFYLEEFNGVAY